MKITKAQYSVGLGRTRITIESVNYGRQIYVAVEHPVVQILPPADLVNSVRMEIDREDVLSESEIFVNSVRTIAIAAHGYARRSRSIPNLTNSEFRSLLDEVARFA